MPRKRQPRKVVEPPKFKGYKPYGSNNISNKSIDLLYEEYEAIKLADYDLLNHNEAGKLMGVSRPTFARIYKSARRKIAIALTEAKEIRAIFGNADISGNWFICDSCFARFTITNTENSCPICKSENIKNINTNKI